METLPLHKIQNIMKFWQELLLSDEDREKRMRKEADKAAQEFHDQLFSGKIKEEDLGSKENGNETDPEFLNRYLDFMSGIDPNLINITNTPQNE